MNNKIKLPDYDKSLFTKDKGLNRKVKQLETNPQHIEMHKKLREVLSKIN